MLRNFAASYKLYWLKGVFDEAVSGSTCVTFEKLAARMIAAAWYPVMYFRLNLGATDKLTSAILCAQQTCGLAQDAESEAVVSAVLESDSPALRRKVKALYDFVPYRLIRPLYADRFDETRAACGPIPDSKINRTIVEFNREDPAGAPYRFNSEGDSIEIDPDWARYFRDNQHVVRGWIDSKLIEYLQARNPSVPAIPLKIYPPNARDLKAARAYWEEALADHVFRDIYSGVPFDAAGYAALGPMGVDHFIPWSFVLHDEPWNLTPMFRDANSSKGNKLPLLGEYLQPFCAQQFDALMTLRGTGRHKRVFESYTLIGANAADYERTDAALEAFTDTVSKVVVPLHQIASNQGFPTWRPAVAYAAVRV